MKRFMSMALVTTMIAACDSDSTGPGTGTGTFQFAVSGAIEETAQGPAWFGSDTNEQGEEVFVLVFGDGSARHFLMVGKEGSARPATGSYPIGETGWDLMHIMSDDDELLGMFVAVDGQVIINASSAGRLSGTITFTAAGFLEGEEEPVEIEGTITFDARPAPTGSVTTKAAARRLR